MSLHVEEGICSRHKGILREWVWLVPVCLAYTLLAALYPVLFPVILRYSLYVIFYVIMPAHALCGLLLPLRLGHAERIFLGYPAALTVLFLFAWFGPRVGLPWAGHLVPVIGLYSIVQVFLGKKKSPLSEPYTLWLTVAVITFSLAVCFRYFTHYHLPTESQPAKFYTDDVLITSLVFSAIKALGGGTLLDGRFTDFSVPYHILQLVDLGFASVTARIHPLLMILYVNPPLHWGLLAGGVVTACRRFAGFSKTGTALAVFLLFYSAGIDFNAFHTLQIYNYFHTFSFGFPSFIILSLLLYGTLTKRIAQMPAIYTGALYFAAAGCKGILLAMIPAALTPVLVLRIYRHEFGRDDIKFICIIGLAAVLLKISMFTAPTYLALKSFDILSSVESLARNAFELLPFVLIVGFLINTDRIAGHRLQADRPFQIFVATFFLLSVAATRLVEFVGGTFYFFWYTRLLLFISFVPAAAFLFERRRNLLLVCTCALLFALGGRFVYFHFFLQSEPPSLYAGHDTTDKYEWDGLMWAYENLDHTKRIIANRTVYFENRPNKVINIPIYDYMALSGMYAYAWHSEWLPNTLKPIAEERLKRVATFFASQGPEAQSLALADIEADYIFVGKRFASYDFSELKELRRIYSNTSIDIYEVLFKSQKHGTVKHEVIHER